MHVIWQANWYGGDSTVVVGEKRWFYYYESDQNEIYINFAHDDNKYLKLEILKITHPVLGDVKGIVTVGGGMDFTVYLCDGTVYRVNAEEFPGKMYDASWKHPLDLRIPKHEWVFDVEANIIETDATPTTDDTVSETVDDYIAELKKLLGIPATAKPMWQKDYDARVLWRQGITPDDAFWADVDIQY